MPTSPHQNKAVLATMVRANDPKATKYIVNMVRFFDGHVTKAAAQIGITQRVIYKWAEKNPGFRAELYKFAQVRGALPKIPEEDIAGILTEAAEKKRGAITRIARKYGVSVSAVSLIVSRKRRAAE